MAIHRNAAAVGAVLVLAAGVLAPGAAPAQPAADEAAPRTAWGAPDLNGVWDFRTLTPFERPEALADQAVFTPEEAAQFEADRLAAFEVRDDQEPADVVGNYNQFWFDPGNRVSETRQTSLVTDPPDGRVPPCRPIAGGPAGPRSSRRGPASTATRRPPAAGSRTSGRACSRSAACSASTPARR